MVECREMRSPTSGITSGTSLRWARLMMVSLIAVCLSSASSYLWKKDGRRLLILAFGPGAGDILRYLTLEAEYMAASTLGKPTFGTRKTRLRPPSAPPREAFAREARSATGGDRLCCLALWLVRLVKCGGICLLSVAVTACTRCPLALAHSSLAPRG